MEYTRGGKHVKKEGEAALSTTDVQCQLGSQGNIAACKETAHDGMLTMLDFPKAGYSLQAKASSHICMLLLQWMIR